MSARRDFRRAYTQGRKVVGRGLILWTVPPAQGAGRARLGLSVPSKVGGAVQRNRFKRLIRESFRLNRPRLQGGDFLVYLRPGCRWDRRAEAERDFLDLARKAGALKA